VPEATFALVMKSPIWLRARLAKDVPAGDTAKILVGYDGTQSGCSIHSEARLEQGVIVDPGVVIGPRAEIGFGTIIVQTA